MHAPSPRSAHKLFLYIFLVNFSGSTVCKGLWFVCDSAYYNKAVPPRPPPPKKMFDQNQVFVHPTPLLFLK